MLDYLFGIVLAIDALFAAILKLNGWATIVNFDKLLNALLGGDPQETISSRMAKRVERDPFAYLVCRILHVFDKNHCQSAIDLAEGGDEKTDHPFISFIVFAGLVTIIVMTVRYLFWS